MTIPTRLGNLLSLIPLLIVVIFALVDNWLWQKDPFLRLARQPLLDGTWTGTLTSIRRGDKDEKIMSEHAIAMIFRQTLTSVSITLITETSKSRSSTAQFRSPQKEDYLLEYQYANAPKLQFRDNLTAHVGGSVIEATGSKPKVVVGEYWTARDTKGTYEIRWVSNKKAGSLQQAQEMAADGGVV